ncbi:MerR family DNA-binding protein [Deinococcus peraridilitoris]|uniref:Putative transcriptional regulator n=1 Tax=Deinococcus peraridilitoris (strain DSM 19664 / LMG 22246 / CIP 109416 / KR-200) TaxID=937777 RepID=L0A8F6_DEIPD|nr:MerR family DNA-binding protein [Deinococcus peraridilitoris]AFZ69709.1 putative transcriptional regulator [Deinococcus peraridilitoris DSM 19664]
MTDTASLPIGQLAAQTNETIKTLRYWTNLGLLTCERQPSGYRHYPPVAIEQARFIRCAQAAGFTLEEVRTVLAIRADGRKPCGHVKVELEAHLVNVRAHIAQLQALEAALQAKVQWADEHPDPECHAAGCVYLEVPA